MPQNREQGFTLIEAIVVVGIIGVLAAVLSSFYIQAMHSYKTGYTTSVVQGDLRFAMNYMTRELRAASNPTINLAKNRISFQDSSGTTRFFQQSGQTIQRHDNQPLCSYVQSLRFTLNENVLTIEIVSVNSLTGGAPQASLPLTISIRIVMRNQ